MKVILLAFLSLLLSIPAAFAGPTELPVEAGVIVPLSGGLAGMGEAFRKGIDLAVADGRSEKAHFLFEDSKYDGKSTVSALHKLRDTDHADLVIVWGNTPSGSAASVAESLKFPMIGVSMNPDAKDKRFVMTVGPSLTQSVDRLEQQISEWNLRAPAAASADFGNALQVLEETKRQLHGALLIKTFANEESDFKTILSGLKAKNTDGVILFALPDQAITFLKQAKQMNFFPMILGGDVFVDDGFRRVASSYSDKLHFLYGDVRAAFIDRLKASQGDVSYYFETACGYAVAMLVNQLAKDLRSIQADPFQNVGKIELEDVSIPAPIFSHTPDRGSHLELRVKIYR